MIQKHQIRKGDKITYTQEILFKGTQTVTATVVAIFNTIALLDNGAEITIF